MTSEQAAAAGDCTGRLLRAANVMRSAAEETEIAALAAATLAGMPGVAHAEVSLDPPAAGGGDPGDDVRVLPLTSGGVVLGAARLTLADAGRYAAGECALSTFLALVAQEIEFRRTQRALRAANAQLEQAALRFADFAHAASDWFWETDAEGRYVYLSPGLRRAGTDPERLLGLTGAEARALLGLRPIEGWQQVERSEALREAYRDLRVHCRDLEGGEHHVELSGRPVFDARGAFQGYRGCGRDVSAIEHASAELRRALLAEREMNAQQRRFVSVASHEFRTPLAVIDGASQRLAARLGGGMPDVAQKLARIRAAVQRMSQMIDRTLNSARLDEGRLELRPGRCELVGLIRGAIEQQRAISPGFEFAFAPCAPIATVVADARLLEHVLTNLLSNAVKFSGTSNRVEIGLERSADGFVVTVRDHGIGIAPDEIGRLFQRFYRTRAASGIAGTGIGLHLVKELVAMHGGDVALESRPGEGTVFRVALPITPAVPVQKAGSAVNA